MRHGFLLIHKPAGPTSHDIVSEVRRVLSETSVGHLGTLDPIASGLLVLAVGAKALKVVELFQHLPKEYIADAMLGSISTTYDSEGTISTVARPDGAVPPENIDAIQVLINRKLSGRIEQIPPVYSAVKIGGERAYRKARRGIALTIPPREVEIFYCTVLEYDYPHLKIKVACSAGTYVRTLIHDIGHLLRCGGYMTGLERTKVGDWKLEDAVKPKDAKWTDVMPLKDILDTFQRMDVTEEEWGHLQHGRSVPGFCTVNTVAWFEDLPRALLEPDPKENGKIKPRKVF